jgi:hypothetical protein
MNRAHRLWARGHRAQSRDPLKSSSVNKVPVGHMDTGGVAFYEVWEEAFVNNLDETWCQFFG